MARIQLRVVTRGSRILRQIFCVRSSGLAVESRGLAHRLIACFPQIPYLETLFGCQK